MRVDEKCEWRELSEPRVEAAVSGEIMLKCVCWKIVGSRRKEIAAASISKHTLIN